jgi:superfamily I DNA/RNA helicase
MENTWSSQQKAIFAHFASGHGNLVARARAGSGKTTTILEACSHAPSTDKILLAAFNKRIAVELTNRVSAPNVEAKTLHSLGFAFIRRQWNNLKIDADVEYARATAALGGDAPYEMVQMTTKLVGLLKNMMPFEMDGSKVKELAEEFDLVPDEAWEEEGWTASAICAAAVVARDAAKVKDEQNRISFDDMIFIPLANKFVRPWYDMVVIDEAQDMNYAQLLLAQKACKSTGRIVVVGDDRQCHPPGVMIEVAPGHETAIEKLHDGEEIRSWNRNAQKMVGGRSIKVGSRRYDGIMHTVTSNDRSVPATSNHRFICRWGNRNVPTCVTYLMWREGFGFRVGWCQLFTKNHRVKMLHLAHRARIEKADKTWILKVHGTRTEASVYESIVAGKYALPTATFEPVHGAQHLTRKTIKEIFNGVSDTVAGSNYDNGVLALSHHGRTFEQHFYPWPGHGLKDMQGRRTYFEVHASNLLPDLMSLPSPDGQNEWHRISSIVNRPYKGIVYSLNVDVDHSYSANGIVVLNCIYQFRGADASSFERLKKELEAKELGLTTTYRCAKSIVRVAQKYVPDFQAGETNPEGIVDHLPDSSMLVGVARPGDFVLSRANAPLMPICLAFLKKGIKARIEGRDVAATLRGIVTGFKAKSVPHFIERVEGWREKQTKRTLKIKKESVREQKIDTINDQADMLAALADGCVNVAEILNRVNTLFGDTEGEGSTQNAVVCSSVHRAKGLEADRVFVLEDTLREDNDEECNIIYVAYTRGKKHLTLVGQRKPRKKSRGNY